MPKKHLDGLGRRLVEIGSVATMIHAPMLTSDGARHGVPPAGPLNFIPDRAATASAFRAVHHAVEQSLCSQAASAIWAGNGESKCVCRVLGTLGRS